MGLFSTKHTQIRDGFGEVAGRTMWRPGLVVDVADCGVFRVVGLEAVSKNKLLERGLSNGDLLNTTNGYVFIYFGKVMGSPGEQYYKITLENGYNGGGVDTIGNHHFIAEIDDTIDFNSSPPDFTRKPPKETQLLFEDNIADNNNE
jgi:hypothetical protein